MLSSSSLPRRLRYGSKLSTTPIPEIISMLRKKSMQLSMIANDTVSFSKEASWRRCNDKEMMTSRYTAVAGEPSYPMVINAWPVSTLSFAFTAMCATLPASFDITSVFIFIASIVATLSPTAMV